MKRLTIAAAAAVLGFGLIGVAPAQADFHGFCPAAGANVSLAQSGGILTFTGTVVCNGSPAAAITSLTLTPLGGATYAGSTASCAPCTSPISGTGTAPSSVAGEWDVRMSFNVAHSSTGQVVNRTRFARYVGVGGVGQPVRVCPAGAGEARCTT